MKGLLRSRGGGEYVAHAISRYPVVYVYMYIYIYYVYVYIYIYIRDGTVYENRPNRSVRLSRFDSRVLRSVHARLLFLRGEACPLHSSRWRYCA